MEMEVMRMVFEIMRIEVEMVMTLWEYPNGNIYGKRVTAIFGVSIGWCQNILSSNDVIWFFSIQLQWRWSVWWHIDVRYAEDTDNDNDMFHNILLFIRFRKKRYITNKENDNDMFDEMLLYVIQLKLKMVMKMTMFDEILLYVTQQTGQTAHSLSL